LHDLWYSSIPHNHSNRPTGDALSAPESTQTFSTATLHRHRRTCSLGKAQLHLVAPRRQLRRFGDDRAIDISNAPPVCPHEGGDMAKHGDGVCPLPLRISVRKVLADITEACSTQQCVGDRMSWGVGIAMTVEANNTFEHTATEDHWPQRIVAESVDIEPLADPKLERRDDISGSVISHVPER
jgi:hypothetical protein